MAYKITIAKRGKKAGEVTLETLDSTSCNVIQDISLQGIVKNNTSINHGDDVPVFDSLHLS